MSQPLSQKLAVFSLYSVIDPEYIEYKIESFASRVNSLRTIPASGFQKQVLKLRNRLIALRDITKAWDGLRNCGGVAAISEKETEGLLEEKAEILDALDTLHLKLDIHIDDCFREQNHQQVRGYEPWNYGPVLSNRVSLTPTQQRLLDFTSSGDERMSISGERSRRSLT